MCPGAEGGADHRPGRDTVPTDRRPSQLRRLGAAAAMTLVVAVALAATAGTAAAAPVQRVSNADIAPDCNIVTNTNFCTDRNGTQGTAAVVDDRQAERGRGYLRLTTNSASDHVSVFAERKRYFGMKLKALNEIALRTLIEQPGSTNNQQAPSINIQINPKKAGSTFTSLVWEPTYTGPGVVQTRVWQQWRPSASKGWWATGAITDTGTFNKYGFATYTATFNDVKNALPDAEIIQLGVNQGSGSPGLVAGVDQLRFNDTTYDFENPLPTADLAIHVETRGPVTPGSTFQATVTVKNTGTATARNVSTALMLGAGVRVANANGGTGLGALAAYQRNELAPGDSVTYTPTLLVDRGARRSVTLFAATHSLTPDPNGLNNATQVIVPLGL
jgi:uncharacterized repeat protein (TIGR01451 family)